MTHVYSGLDIVYENGSSGWTRHYYANGLHIVENRSGTVEYFHHDHLGSTRLKTNTTGEVVYEANYVPFGPDIQNLKRFAAMDLPRTSLLRAVLLSERDRLTAVDFLAKMDVWLKLFELEKPNQ